MGFRDTVLVSGQRVLHMTTRLGLPINYRAAHSGKGHSEEIVHLCTEDKISNQPTEFSNQQTGLITPRSTAYQGYSPRFAENSNEEIPDEDEAGKRRSNRLKFKKNPLHFMSPKRSFAEDRTAEDRAPSGVAMRAKKKKGFGILSPIKNMSPTKSTKPKVDEAITTWMNDHPDDVTAYISSVKKNKKRKWKAEMHREYKEYGGEHNPSFSYAYLAAYVLFHSRKDHEGMSAQNANGMFAEFNAEHNIDQEEPTEREQDLNAQLDQLSNELTLARAQAKQQAQKHREQLTATEDAKQQQLKELESAKKCLEAENEQLKQELTQVVAKATAAEKACLEAQEKCQAEAAEREQALARAKEEMRAKEEAQRTVDELTNDLQQAKAKATDAEAAQIKDAVEVLKQAAKQEALIKDTVEVLQVLHGETVIPEAPLTERLTKYVQLLKASKAAEDAVAAEEAVDDDESSQEDLNSDDDGNDCSFDTCNDGSEENDKSDFEVPSRPVDKYRQLCTGDGQLTKHYDRIGQGINTKFLGEVLKKKDKTYWMCPACDKQGDITFLPICRQFTYIVAAGKSTAEFESYQIDELKDNGQRFADSRICMWAEITKAQQTFYNGGNKFHTGRFTTLRSVLNHECEYGKERRRQLEAKKKLKKKEKKA